MNMKLVNTLALICIPGGLLSVPVRGAEGDHAAAEAWSQWKDLKARITGCWAIDKDAMLRAVREETGEGHAGSELLQKILDDMELLLTAKVTADTLVVPGPDGPSELAYTIQSQDAVTGIIKMELTGKGGTKHSCSGRAHLESGRLTLTGMLVGDKPWTSLEPLLMVPIDERIFELRCRTVSKMPEPETPEPRLEGGSDTSRMDRERADGTAPAPAAGNDGYPVADPVPNKPGFVFSPFNRRVIDVRDIPSGTLVRDPTGPADGKNLFRVP